jgi:hypothetical protein
VRGRALSALSIADADLVADSPTLVLDRSTGVYCRLWAVGDEIERGLRWEDFALNAHRSRNGLTFAHYRAILEASLAMSLNGDAAARNDACALIVALKLPDLLSDTLRRELRTEYSTIGRSVWTSDESDPAPLDTPQ